MTEILIVSGATIVAVAFLYYIQLKFQKEIEMYKIDSIDFKDSLDKSKLSDHVSEICRFILENPNQVIKHDVIFEINSGKYKNVKIWYQISANYIEIHTYSTDTIELKQLNGEINKNMNAYDKYILWKVLTALQKYQELKVKDLIETL